MNRRAVLIGGAAGAAAYALSGSPANALPRAIARQVDEAAREALQASAAPGIQIAIARRGRIEYSRGFGLADREAGVSVTRRTVFCAGSITKQFTAAAAIKLASQGKLDLNAPLGRYLPFMEALPQTNALELMHQTAGLHSDENDTEEVGGLSQIELARRIASQARPFDFSPGSAWLYSNSNYIVLGALLEAVSRMPLAQVYGELLMDPLRLSSTSMDDGEGIVARRATGYGFTWSEPPALERAERIDVTQAGGAGALRSTAHDLCNWHGALLGGRVLNAEGLALMLAPGRLRDGRLSGANRFSEQDAQYGDVQYACGLLVSPPTEPNPSVLHYGFISGFSAVLQTYTNENLTIAVMCNGDPNPALPFRAIRHTLTQL